MIASGARRSDGADSSEGSERLRTDGWAVMAPLRRGRRGQELWPGGLRLWLRCQGECRGGFRRGRYRGAQSRGGGEGSSGFSRGYGREGRYHIDNNPVERSQRPSVMGRKNYMFSKSDSGAVDNAIFYSLIESCDIVGMDPLKWLTPALRSIKDDTPPELIKLMLPYYYKKSCE